MKADSSRSDFWGGVLIGVSLGLVWTPCVGPIVASVITLSATSSVTASSVLITAAYALGVSVPLLVITYGGKGLIARVRSLSAAAPKLQMAFGAIMILTAVSMLLGYDRTIQTTLLAKLPSGIASGLTQGLEQSDAVQSRLKSLTKSKETMPAANQIVGGEVKGLPVLEKAPELTSITNWLNSDPLTLSSLKGKVVLIDFWTYSCINCIRTLPHVTNWYETYKGQGFVVIGVHAPEFAFEKDAGNVAKAIKQYGINYPVAQDNDFATWKAYSNQYWPAHYLIDAHGNLRYTHFGEGEYETTETNIRSLLKEAKGSSADLPTASASADMTPSGRLSPETYLGTERRERFQPSASTLQANQWTLTGDWESGQQYIASADAESSLSYNFSAKDAYLVLNPPAEGAGSVEILIDGKAVDNPGTDATKGMITVDTDRLYHLVHFGGVESHLLTIKFKTKGIKAFAFTFG